MKRLLSLLLIILLLTGCAATYDGPTELKPVLTEHTAQHYSNLFGSAELLYTTRTVYAYDIYGNMVRTREYRNGELETVTNLRYDDRGNLIARTVWDHSGWIPLITRREKRTYDDKDRPLTIVYCNGWGRETDRSVYAYDDAAGTRTYQDETGEILQTTWYDENGLELRQTAGEYETVYEYDDRGNQTGWVSYKNGTPDDSYQARYDEQNRLVWSGWYNESGHLESQSEYDYDDEAHTMTRRLANGKVRHTRYLPDGRLSRIEDYSIDGDISIVQKYIYQNIKVPAEGGEMP